MDDKLQPSVTYLQKLGPEYLDLIFQTSKWVLGQDRDFGFQVPFVLVQLDQLLNCP
jgi:hypothetical protein